MAPKKQPSDNAAIHHIGAERRPVIVIENFLPDPEALRAEAESAAFQPLVRFFPGVQAPFAFERMNQFIEPHRTTISEAFENVLSFSIIECGFALVTTPPSELLPLQRIPHIDATEPHRLAILAYVSGTQFGGTAFYRHKSTGYEYLDQSRNDLYNIELDRDVEKFGVPKPEYIAGDTDIFDQIAKFDAQPGRAIIYASNSLHSGRIQDAENLSNNVACGRLTLNAFLAPHMQQPTVVK